MALAIALLYLASVIIIGLAGLGFLSGQSALVGAACGLLAFSLPVIAAGFR